MGVTVGFVVKNLRDFRMAVFGLAVFDLVWILTATWSEWELHKFIFMAALLFLASVLVLIKSVWSNFLAATLCGYLPVQFAFEFWSHSLNAELRMFSFRHFSSFLKGVLSAGAPVLMFLAISTIILACSAHFFIQLSRQRQSSARQSFE